MYYCTYSKYHLFSKLPGWYVHFIRLHCQSVLIASTFCPFYVCLVTPIQHVYISVFQETSYFNIRTYLYSERPPISTYVHTCTLRDLLFQHAYIPVRETSYFNIRTYLYSERPPISTYVHTCSRDLLFQHMYLPVL